MADRGNVTGVIAIVRRQLGTQYDCIIDDVTATRVAVAAGYIKIVRGRYGGRRLLNKGAELLRRAPELIGLFENDLSDVANPETLNIRL